MNFRSIYMTRKESARYLESFLTMLSVMYRKMEISHFPSLRTAAIFLFLSEIMGPVFPILPKILFSGVSTEVILQETTGSILVSVYVLPTRSLHCIKEPFPYRILRAEALISLSLCLLPIFPVKELLTLINLNNTVFIKSLHRKNGINIQKNPLCN